MAEVQVGHLNLSGVGRIQYLAQNFLFNPFYNSGSEKDPPPCQDVPHQHEVIQLARDEVYLLTLTCDWLEAISNPLPELAVVAQPEPEPFSNLA